MNEEFSKKPKDELDIAKKKVDGFPKENKYYLFLNNNYNDNNKIINYLVDLIIFRDFHDEVVHIEDIQEIDYVVYDKIERNINNNRDEYNDVKHFHKFLLENKKIKDYNEYLFNWKILDEYIERGIYGDVMCEDNVFNKNPIILDEDVNYEK